MTASSPKVATNSLNIWAGPERAWPDAKKSGSSNIRWAAATPAKAPRPWAARYGGTSDHARPPCVASPSVTAGLKWAPEIGPKVRISATRAAPPARRSPMIPDPTTAARSSAVPTASAVSRRPRLARSATEDTLRGFAGANERAHEPVRHLGRDGIDVDPRPRQEVPGFLDAVDASRLKVDSLEPGRCELVSILSLFQRTGHAADPELA